MNNPDSALKHETDLEMDLADKKTSLKTLVTAVATGLVFWASLFALLFFCLTS